MALSTLALSLFLLHTGSSLSLSSVPANLAPLAPDDGAEAASPPPAGPVTIQRQFTMKADLALKESEPLGSSTDKSHLTSKRIQSRELRFRVTDQIPAAASDVQGVTRTYGELSGRHAFEISSEQFVDKREAKAMSIKEALVGRIKGAVVRFAPTDEGHRAQHVSGTKLSQAQLDGLQADLSLTFLAPVGATKRGEHWEVEGARVVDLLTIGHGLPTFGKTTRRALRPELSSVLASDGPVHPKLAHSGVIRMKHVKTKRSRRASTYVYSMEVDVRAKVAQDDDSESFMPPGMGVERVVEYKGEGTMHWDPEAAMITRLDLELDLRSVMTMSMSLAAPGFPAEEAGQRELDEGEAKIEYRAEIQR